MSKYYKLGPDGQTPQECTLEEWGGAGSLHTFLRESKIGTRMKVLTVFFGFEHDGVHDDRGPLLFGSMVMGGPLEGVTEYSVDYTSAMVAHGALVERVKTALREITKR